MTREEINMRLNSTILMLKAHPHSGEGSEMNDRIDDLKEIQLALCGGAFDKLYTTKDMDNAYDSGMSDGINSLNTNNDS